MRRAERLFQIVQIIGASQWTTAQALAERLAVSERTIYRDIDHLSASGVPVYSQAGKGYALLEGYQLPKIYVKQYYCVEAAVHQRIVRSRSSTDRRVREPPARFRPRQQ